MKKIILALCIAITSFSAKEASAYSAYLVNDPKISIDSSYVLDVEANNLTYATAVAEYDDGTPAAKTFTDGQISTGNITVADLAALTTAYASNTITVLSTSNLANAQIALPGYTFKQTIDWRVGSSTSATAASIATALAKIPWLTVTRDYAVITITAKVPGAYYNTIPVSSNHASITVATPYMAGGQDNAVLTINGIELRHNLNWYVGATSATAATSIAAAINGNTALAALLTATANSPSDGIVALASDATGASKNFSLYSSAPDDLVLSGAVMTGGADPAYSIGSGNIRIPSHGFNLALPVLYTEDTEAILPLVDQTTYYVIPVDSNNIKLAERSTDAVAGVFITMTSSAAPSHTYTLSPLEISGNSSFKWEVSTDNVNWSDMAVASVTISDYGTLPLSTSWDLDTSKDYIRLSLLAPDSGALNLSVLVDGLPLSEFARTSGDTFTGRVNMLNAPLIMTGASGYLTSASTITAVQFAGPLVGNVTGSQSGGSVSATTLSASGAGYVAGEFTMGAAATKSTMTATGSLTMPGTLSASAVTAGGTVTAATVNVSGSGQVLLGNATAAELATLVPGQANGALIFNSTDQTICQSTAAVAGSWALPRGPAKDSAFVSCY